MNEEVVHIHGWKYSLLLRCQFFPTGSIDSVQSQSKSQQAMCEYQQTGVKVYIDRQETQNGQPNTEEEPSQWIDTT